MEGFAYMDSAAAALFLIPRAVTPRGGGVVLLGARPQILEVSSLLGLERFFTFCSTLDEAVEHSASGARAPFPCPRCGARLKAPSPGRYRCGRCKTLLSIDASGQVCPG
jgi:anti-sigma B factor antagonist